MKNLRYQLPWLILCLGGLCSGWTAWVVRHDVESDAYAEFQMHATEFQASIRRRLLSYENILFGAAGLYIASDTVTARQFEAYADSLDLENRAKSILSLNYAEYFLADDKNRFELESGLRTQADGPASRDFLLTLAPGSREHLVIVHVFPTGSHMIGFDLMSTAHRLLETPHFSRLSSRFYQPNAVTSSGIPIRAPGTSKAALGLRLGIFKPDSRRQAVLKGSVGILFSVEEFFSKGLPQPVGEHIAYRISNIGRSNGTTYSPSIPVFSHNADNFDSVNDSSQAYSASFVQPFGGALLRIELREEKTHLIHERDRLLPFVVFVIGCLLSVMASILLHKIFQRKQILEREVQLRTRELTEEINRAQRLEREVVTIAEQERRRIGYELHDEIGQRLTGMSLGLRALSEQLKLVSSEVAAHVAALEHDTSEAITNVRQLAHGLTPVPVGDSGLRDALEELVARLSSHAICCTFDFDDPVGVSDENVATHLYRIAQEALNNAIKHSRATLVEVRLDYEAEKIMLLIKDNGIGLPKDGPEHGGGAGMRIMRHRASVIGFSFKANSDSGGTTIEVREC